MHQSCNSFALKKLSHNTLHTRAGGLTSCQDATIQQLSSFDSYVDAQKASGVRQVEFETRFQETVWDTIEMDASRIPRVFPAESDKAWAVREYGRGLSLDLASFQKIAERVVPRGDLAYVHARIDRLRGLQFTGAVLRYDVSAALVSVQQMLGGECAVKQRSVGLKARVYVVLPYSHRAERLRLILEKRALIANAAQGRRCDHYLCVAWRIRGYQRSAAHTGYSVRV
eukprot:IDg16022t1